MLDFVLCFWIYKGLLVIFGNFLLNKDWCVCVFVGLKGLWKFMCLLIILLVCVFLIGFVWKNVGVCVILWFLRLLYICLFVCWLFFKLFMIWLWFIFWMKILVGWGVVFCWVVVVGGVLVVYEDCYVFGFMWKFVCCWIGEFFGMKERYLLLLFLLNSL